MIDDLRQSLSMVLEQTAIPIELQDRKYGVRVGDHPRQRAAAHRAGSCWPSTAQMPAEALRARFPTQVKIGPVERIRDLVNLQLPGVALRPLPVAPRQIPYHAGFNYFELETRSSELWKQLERRAALAMHIAGEFPGLELEFWAIALVPDDATPRRPGDDCRTHERYRRGRSVRRLRIRPHGHQAERRCAPAGAPARRGSGARPPGGAARAVPAAARKRRWRSTR